MNETRGRHGSWHGDAARLRRRGRRGSACSPARAASGGSRNFEVSDLPCKIAGQIPRGDGSNGTFNADQWMEPKEQRKVDDFILYAMGAAKQALDDADWHPREYEDQVASGVLIGSGIGGIEGIAETALLHCTSAGPRRVSPFFIPGRIINLASGYVSIAHSLKGPNHAVVTACSTGAHAIGDAGRLVALGDADVMVAGGTESPVNRISLAGFAACRALSTGFNETPERASRPYDRDRDGFVMGEGAGTVVLEEYEHAKRRGARIYGELVGYGLSGDAYHITAPAEDGDGALRCMKAALRRADMSPGGHRLHQRSWHLDSARRRESSSRPWSGWSAIRPARSPCRRPNPRSATCSARRAPSRRSSACWRCAIRWRRRRSISTTPRWIPPIDLVPHKARKPPDQCGAVELVRLRRHQCFARFPAHAGIVPDPCTVSPYLLRTRLRRSMAGCLLALPNGQCGRTGEHSPAGWGLTFIADHA